VCNGSGSFEVVEGGSEVQEVEWVSMSGDQGATVWGCGDKEVYNFMIRISDLIYTFN
jgi:hypothetical protein